MVLLLHRRILEYFIVMLFIKFLLWMDFIWMKTFYFFIPSRFIIHVIRQFCSLILDLPLLIQSCMFALFSKFVISRLTVDLTKRILLFFITKPYKLLHKFFLTIQHIVGYYTGHRVCRRFGIHKLLLELEEETRKI